MERNRKAGSKSSRNTAINNAELIKAVTKLKQHHIITQDVDIAVALNYSKPMVSEYLNNKRKVSEVFMIKFNQHYFPKPLFNGSTQQIIQLLKDNQSTLAALNKNIEILVKKL